MNNYYIVADKYEAVSVTAFLLQSMIHCFEEALLYSADIIYISTTKNLEEITILLQEYNDMEEAINIIDYLSDSFDKATYIFRSKKLFEYELSHFQSLTEQNLLNTVTYEDLIAHKQFKSLSW